MKKDSLAAKVATCFSTLNESVRDELAEMLEKLVDFFEFGPKKLAGTSFDTKHRDRIDR